MGNDQPPSEAATPALERVPQAPAPVSPSDHGSFYWFGSGMLRGLLVLLVLGGAIYGAVQLRLIPRDLGKAPPSTAPNKLVVRYVLAERFQAGQRPPGTVYIAEVRGDNEMNLSFDVGGVVELIGPSANKSWEQGAHVEAGAILARLRQDDFANRVKEAQSQADLARVNYERLKNLVKSQSVPQAQLDQATASKKTADAQLAAAEQALKDTVLRAPEDGTLLARLVNPAEVVSPGRAVLRFSNLRRMSVEVGVPDTIVGHIKVGQELSVEFSALGGQKFVGRVAEVGVAGEEGSRLFRVKLKVANPEGRIKSGMTASVSFVPAGSLPAGAVWIPLAALAADGKEQLAVYVLADGKAHKRPVQTDEIAGNRILVTKGLQAGDKVVVAGVGTLYDAAPVDAAPISESFQ